MKPVEFEKWLVEVEDFPKITDHFRGIYKIYLKLSKKNRMTGTLGSQLIMWKVLPDIGVIGPWVYNSYGKLALQKAWFRWLTCKPSLKKAAIYP